MTILLIFVYITWMVFSELMEAYNISQNSDCPHFCDSIRSTSAETHILYQGIYINMWNFICRWDVEFVVTIIQLTRNNENYHPIIYLFQLANNIWVLLKCLSVFCFRLYNHIYSDLFINHIISCNFILFLCHREWVFNTCRVYTRNVFNNSKTILFKNTTYVFQRGQGRIYVRRNLIRNVYYQSI